MRNPHSTAALTVEELTIDRRVRAHSNGQSTVLRILGKPFMWPSQGADEGTPAIRVLDERFGDEEERSLGDLGVVPTPRTTGTEITSRRCSAMRARLPGGPSH
jgi:hypothetical protein